MLRASKCHLLDRDDDDTKTSHEGGCQLVDPVCNKADNLRGEIQLFPVTTWPSTVALCTLTQFALMSRWTKSEKSPNNDNTVYRTEVALLC